MDLEDIWYKNAIIYAVDVRRLMDPEGACVRKKQTISLNLYGKHVDKLRPLLGLGGEDGIFDMELPPYGYAWYRVVRERSET